MRLLGVGSSASVVVPDLPACGNGIVHIIDGLLLPVQLPGAGAGQAAGQQAALAQLAQQAQGAQAKAAGAPGVGVAGAPGAVISGA